MLKRPEFQIISRSPRNKYIIIIKFCLFSVGQKILISHPITEPDDIPTYKALLDCITVQLRDMDIWTATRKDYNPELMQENTDFSFDIIYNGFMVSRDPKSLLMKRVLLSLSIERNLEQTKDRSIPDMSVVGTLTKGKGTLKVPTTFQGELLV
jgi:hypothetical protein